ncbi:MAG: hypothetical protein KKE17_01685 [Proteobacteria bacterium]|nr:hypothetical protein [Pseudomonadota bacterium]MBU1708693.1 hypothetical protein [Pseudomonadota bacterium]
MNTNTKTVNSYAVTLAILIIVSWAHPCHAEEIRSRFTTIDFGDEITLQELNRNLLIDNLEYMLKNKTSLTISEEVADKLDVIVEKVEEVLEMFPENLQFKVVLLPTSLDVQNLHREKYGRKVPYIAFYAPRDNTVYISTQDASLAVITHEIAHVVLTHYLEVSPSSKIHEVLAQYAEQHIVQ